MSPAYMRDLAWNYISEDNCKLHWTKEELLEKMNLMIKIAD